MHITWLQLPLHFLAWHDLDARCPTCRQNEADRRSRKHGKPCAYIILCTIPPHAVTLSPYFSASVRHLALVDLTRTNYWLALCDVATSYYYGCWLYYYGTNTPRSESKTIYILSLWCICKCTIHYIQQVINTQRQRGYMLDYRLVPTKHSSKY